MICLRFLNSAVAYTVALGLFLAVGRETTGKIPPGKVCTHSSPVHSTPQKFENGTLTLKTLQLFSVHTTPEKFQAVFSNFSGYCGGGPQCHEADLEGVGKGV